MEENKKSEEFSEETLDEVSVVDTDQNIILDDSTEKPRRKKRFL